MSMRIIAGELKGRRIRLPADLGIRPTQDKVREAMFSTLGGYIELESAAVLDLFTGSGSLGLEAISRGARGSMFVEQSRRVADLLNQTVHAVGVADRASVICGTIPSCLTTDSAAPFFRKVGGGPEFDLVFIDPPYDHNPGTNLIVELVRKRLVKAGSLVLLEARAPGKEGDLSEDQSLADPLLRIEKLKRREYGQTTVDYFIIQSRAGEAAAGE